MYYVVQGTSLNNLYKQGIQLLEKCGELEETRNGPAYVAPAPVLTVWLDPRQRVLLNSYRNCNHAFHINEAIWMLRGERDATKLDTFVHDFSERYAESDGLLWGAYGYRWREAFGEDQLEELIFLLKKDRTTRQAVLQMWDSNHDLGVDAKDKPCNTHVYFRIHNDILDMTVCNRSNDIIWGLYGANAVHFSILMEYMAGQVGVEMGCMYTLSNNFHAYKDIFKKLYPFYAYTSNMKQSCLPLPKGIMDDILIWDYTGVGNFKTEWFNYVAVPVTKCFLAHKAKDLDKTAKELSNIKDLAWRRGMGQWTGIEP